MYYVIGTSVSSLFRESTDSLIVILMCPQVTSAGDIQNTPPGHENRAIEVITQTLEDILTHASDQPLPMVT